jgi:hypothetical protein
MLRRQYEIHNARPKEKEKKNIWPVGEGKKPSRKSGVPGYKVQTKFLSSQPTALSRYPDWADWLQLDITWLIYNFTAAFRF